MSSNSGQNTQKVTLYDLTFTLCDRYKGIVTFDCVLVCWSTWIEFFVTFDRFSGGRVLGLQWPDPAPLSVRHKPV